MHNSVSEEPATSIIRMEKEDEGSRYLQNVYTDLPNCET
jgi:hypothetical protein